MSTLKFDSGSSDETTTGILFSPRSTRKDGFILWTTEKWNTDGKVSSFLEKISFESDRNDLNDDEQD